jgi:hypothetical protein
MSTVIEHTPAEANEIGLGVVASIPGHWLIAIGEYADHGEADIDIRVLGAVDEGGNDISEKVAKVIAAAVERAIEGGTL